MGLSEQIEKKRREIKTDAYPMSIGEWVSMYEKDELDIHPEFQRFYRWTSSQKTALIESILLGIPIPPIFVSQRQDGIWDVVDGLQRLSTIFQFMGILKNEKNEIIEPLLLEKTHYLPDLDGVKWGSNEIPDESLSKDLQLVIKRSKISASIILKESDETTKYDLFQRLNTGGSELSSQEVRNCVLVMLNRPLFIWLKSLASGQPFASATSLSDRSIEEAYDMELALRFIVFSQAPETNLKGIGDIGSFLTDQMREIAKSRSFSKPKNRELFENTFKLIDAVLGDNAFKRYDSQKSKNLGGFLLSLYEVIAFGIAYNISNNTLCAQSKIPERVQSLWKLKEFTKWAAPGINASRRISRLVPLGRQLFKK